jgi:hypothetical protein
MSITILLFLIVGSFLLSLLMLAVFEQLRRGGSLSPGNEARIAGMAKIFKVIFLISIALIAIGIIGTIISIALGGKRQ